MSNYNRWKEILGDDLFGELENLVYLGSKKILKLDTFKKEYDQFMDKIPSSVSNESIVSLHKFYQSIVRHYK